MTISAIITGAALDKATSVAADKASNLVNSGMNSGLTTAVKVAKEQLNKGAGRTLVTASNDLRVEPFVLIDERASRLSYISDVMEIVQRLFSSYYLLSVASDNLIGGATVSKRLGKFNPERDLLNASTQFLSVESYQFGLPFGGTAVGFDRYESICKESYMPHYDDISFESDGKKERSGNTNIQKQAMEIANLSIGSIVNVDIVDGNSKTTVPVMIRMRTIGTSSNGLVDILGLGMVDNSRSARWMKFRVGAISLRELITNQDIIDNYRRAMFRDKSGYFRKAHTRKTKGLAAHALTKEPSIGAISSIVILTDETRREVERKHFGSFDDFERRQQVFEESLLMMMVVLDDDMGTMTIYTRDIVDPQTYTIDELTRSAKKSGNNNLDDIIKVMLSGGLPGRL